MIAAKLDRMFRSALDALRVVEELKELRRLTGDALDRLEAEIATRRAALDKPE